MKGYSLANTKGLNKKASETTVIFPGREIVAYSVQWYKIKDGWTQNVYEYILQISIQCFECMKRAMLKIFHRK